MSDIISDLKHPYGTAPKDGRYVILGDGEGIEYEMRWDADAVNLLVGHEPGLWVLRGGGATWCDRQKDGAPGYWKPVTEDRKS